MSFLRVTLVLLIASGCTTADPSPDKPGAEVGTTHEVDDGSDDETSSPPEDTHTSDDTGEPPVETDPWPDPATLPDGSVSVVFDGTVLTDGQQITVDTPPAGLPDRTSLRFVLTNRTDETLTLPVDPAAWITNERFVWTEAPPDTLEPEHSIELLFSLSVEDDTAATSHTATLTVPGGPTVALEAVVPRPLRTVVVGSGGYVAVSDSYGAAWETEQHPDDGRDARDVEWGSGRFLRSDRETGDWFAPGVYQWSDDGLTWHDATTTEEFWVSDCTYAWSQFFCARSASLTSSADGSLVLHNQLTWGDLLNGITFVPGDEVDRAADSTDPDALFLGDRLVAVGRSGSRRLSSDGTEWTADVSSDATDYLNAIAYGNGVVVAVGGSNNIVAHASTDGGETWTETLLHEEIYSAFYSVVYGNGVFLAGASSNEVDQLWQSTDGITWTGLGRERVVPLTFVNGWFIATIQPWGQQGELLRSRDGITWDTVHTLPLDVTADDAAAEQWEAP